ncbi:MAG: 30S ribosomal protein S6 [Chloroflexi bacterium]|nr:30S ribosomal protein S6 [Chloroflexota bacterium]
MPSYELVLVVQPTMEEEPLNALVDKITQTISDLKGQVHQVDAWGKRRLAYSIMRYREGFYFLIQAEMPASAVRGLERSLKLMEDVLRYLVVRQVVEPAPAKAETAVQ